MKRKKRRIIQKGNVNINELRKTILKYIYNNSIKFESICRYKAIEYKENGILDDKSIEKFFSYNVYIEDIIKKNLNKMNIKVLRDIVCKYYKQEDPLEEYPILKLDIVNWIFEKIYGYQSKKLKRNIEKNYIIQDNIILLCSIIVPIEIIFLIFSYIKKDNEFLNGIGSVNTSFYLAALRSFRRTYIHNDNIYKIPLLVLENVSELIIYKNPKCRHNIYREYFLYLLSNIKNITKLKCSFNSVKMLNTIRIKKIKLLKLKKLHIDDSSSFSSIKRHSPFKLSKVFIDLLPKLKKLIITFTYIYGDVFNLLYNLEEIYFIRNIFISDNEANLPSYLIKLTSLKTLGYDYNMVHSDYKTISNIKNLKKFKKKFKLEKKKIYLNLNIILKNLLVILKKLK